MTTLYALVLNICLANGECFEIQPAIYTDLVSCVAEAAHQRTVSDPGAYCLEVKEEELP
jgi:hypothetical protein